jgi:hypothetical protein
MSPLTGAVSLPPYFGQGIGADQVLLQVRSELHRPFHVRQRRENRPPKGADARAYLLCAHIQYVPFPANVPYYTRRNNAAVGTIAPSKSNRTMRRAIVQLFTM